MPSLRFLGQLRDRRIIQIVASYAAAAWIALEVVDQLVDRGILPEWTYLILLVWALGGFAASAVVGWYHGEKGAQEVTRVEIAILVLVGAGTLLATGMTLREYRESLAVAGVLDAASGLDARRLAVLYFEDVSSDGELSFLADGLTEGLIDELTTVSGLDVVSRNGSAQYRDSGLRTDSVARLLDAGTYVVGLVEGHGEDVRVELGLFDSESAATIARGSFERPAEAASELRAGLTQEVSRFLRTWLGEEVRLREGRASTVSDAAWILVQRAERAHKDARALLADDAWGEATAAFERAESLLVQAEPLAPDWAGPLVARARLRYERSRLQEDAATAAAMMQDAVDFVERALKVEPRNADALEIRGTVRYLRWLLALEPDPVAAERLLLSAEQDLRTATAVDPLQAGAWNVLAHLYNQMDDIVEANLAARRAYEADAFLTEAPDILWRLWSTSYDLENRTQSRHWCEEGRERFPDNPRFHECGLWNMTSGAGDPDADAAWQLSAAVLERTPQHERDLVSLRMSVLVAGALAVASARGRDEALADSSRAVLGRSLGDAQVDPTRELLLNHAFVRALLGDNAEAVDLLQEYLTFNPDRREGFAEHGHWWWRELRNDEAFRRMIGA